MDFWIDNPKVLFQAKYIQEVWIDKSMNMNQKLNALTRLIILLSLLGFICFNRSLFLVIGLLLIIAMVIFYKQYAVEGMTSCQRPKTTCHVMPSNPMNNVLVTDYKENPHLKPSHPEYSLQVENNINTSALTSILLQNKDNKDIHKGFGTSRDQFEFEQSMRPFFTQPVNSVDKVEYGDFLKYCYGALPSDKPLKIS
jgi:hypothetical protein